METLLVIPQTLLDGLTAFLAAHPLAVEWYTAFVRFLFPALAILILYRAIRSLLKIPHTPETWGQLSLPNGAPIPLTHWENILGRGRTADIQLNYPSVSRQHAALCRGEDDSWTVYDLGSKGGTTVNGKQVEGSAPVKLGDTIALGGVPLLFLPQTVAEREELEEKRRAERPAAMWPSFLWLTLFQVLACLQLITAAGQKASVAIPLAFLGLTAVITRVEIQESTLRYEIPFMMVATVLLLVLGYTGYSITFVEGVVLWALFLLFLGYLFRSAKSGKGEDEADAEEKSEAMSVARCLLYMVVGGFLVVKGSDFAVMGASDIARFFGISERIIGLTIVALGTSLPELVTSVTAARRGDAGIAIGNIVGSNVFNILFVLSTTALIVDVPFAPAFMVDMGVAIVSGVILWAGAYMYRGLNRTVGAVMLVAYGIYFVYLCL